MLKKISLWIFVIVVWWLFLFNLLPNIDALRAFGILIAGALLVFDILIGDQKLLQQVFIIFFPLLLFAIIKGFGATISSETGVKAYYVVSLVALWFLALIFLFHFDGGQGTLHFNHYSDSGIGLLWVTLILGVIFLPSSLAAGLTGFISNSGQIAILSWLFYSVVQVLILGGIVSEKSEFQVTSIALKLSLPLLELLIAAIQYLGKFAKIFS